MIDYAVYKSDCTAVGLNYAPYHLIMLYLLRGASNTVSKVSVLDQIDYWSRGVL